MTFYVGQKVVCVEDDWGLQAYDCVRPKAGQVLTIRSILNHDKFPVAALRFSEIVNPVFWYWDIGEGECCFDCRKFRPAVERKTDISIFQKMLKHESVPATAGPVRQTEGADS